MDPVIFIHLALPPVAALDGFAQETRLLSRSHSFSSHIVLGFIEPTLRKDASVSGIFDEVAPHDGAWSLEIGVVLPDTLPTIEGRSEAVVVVRGADQSERAVCLSNRMSRFHFQDETHARHILTPRTGPWHGQADVTTKSGAKKPASEEQLGTMVAMRFRIEGPNTEAAFETNIGNCLDIFFESVNVILHATRHVDVGTPPVVGSLSRNSVPEVYVLVSGTGDAHGAKLILTGPRTSRNVPDISGDAAHTFRGVAKKSIEMTDVDQLLGRAKSSFAAGEFEFAFLQLVIASEIATARAVHNECLRRGISKNRLDNARKDLTYSWALNIGLKLAFTPDARPNDDLITAMNTARERRNDLMHKAEFSLGRTDIYRLIRDTKEYIAAIRTAESASK